MTSLILIAAAMGFTPTPQSMEFQGKHVFRLLGVTPVVVADDATPEECAALDGLFQAIGFKLTIRRASQHDVDNPAVYVGEPGRHASFEKRKVRKYLHGKDVESPQGYRLCIDRDAIVVAGTSPAGTLNGLKTLAIVARKGVEVPCLEVRDYPNLAVRGASFTGPVTVDQVRALGAMKCNWAVFESEDFYQLSDQAAKQWRGVFDAARACGIEPVPVLQTLSAAGPLLELYPAAAEGRIAVDHLVLTGDDWKTLSRRNVIFSETSPIQVQVSGHACVWREDYAIDKGGLAYPYSAGDSPWLIRRVPGGSIPDRATVTVTYTYVPEGTAACCPHAPEAESAVKQILDRIADTLEPRFVHVGLGDIDRLNECARCRAKAQSGAVALSSWIATLDKLAKKASPDLRLVLWADAINPWQDAARYGTAAVGRLLPEDVVVQLRIPESTDGLGDMLDWCAALDRDYLGTAGASPSNVYAWCNALQGRGERCLGLVYPDGDTADEACTLTMEKGWSVATPRLAWPESFNAAFGASLWKPGYAEILDALTAYTNRQTLAGVRPRDHYDAFAESTKTLRETMPEEEAIIELTGNVYKNLTRYLELEQDFAEDRRASVLNGLTSLIEDQAEIDPETDADRVARIVETVENKGLFVPSTILFKRQVLPYRPMKLIEGYQAFETQGTPTFTDTKNEATATYDFLSPPGYVCRVDFDTVGTATLDVAYSEDGQGYKSVQQWTSQEVGGVAGPAILDNPLRARYLRVTAHAPAEQAVLRNTRVFALKPPAQATCIFAKTNPKTGGGYDAIDWPPDGQAEAFVCLDKPFFAEAQTAAAFYRTRDMLIVGLTASEPRIRTMVSEMKDRDAALWEEESFEIVLSTGEGELFRFVVNPLGAQFDSRGWDPGWNGEWHVSAGQDDTSWAAVIEIPFNTLGVTPQSGARWGVNFVRNRKNVQSERSAWQTGADPYRVDKLGSLTFK